MAANAGATKNPENETPSTDDLLTKIAEMAGEIDSLREIASNAYGVDVALQKERATAKRVPVQFKVHFARAAEPSKIQKNFNRVEQYFAENGRIYLVREDEAARLETERKIVHVPAANGRTRIEHRVVVETDPKKFTDMTVTRVIRREDHAGRPYLARESETIDVKTLRENAQTVG